MDSTSKQPAETNSAENDTPQPPHSRWRSSLSQSLELMAIWALAFALPSWSGLKLTELPWGAILLFYLVCIMLVVPPLTIVVLNGHRVWPWLFLVGIFFWVTLHYHKEIDRIMDLVPWRKTAAVSIAGLGTIACLYVGLKRCILALRERKKLRSFKNAAITLALAAVGAHSIILAFHYL